MTTENESGSWGYSADKERWTTGYNSREDATADGLEAEPYQPGIWTGWCVPEAITYPGAANGANVLRAF